MSRMYRNKQEYIDNLRTVIDAREDFKDLEYHRNPTTQEEYLFLSDIVGRVFMFDITGKSNDQIYHVMAMVECGQKPDCYITDPKKMMELGKLFN